MSGGRGLEPMGLSGRLAQSWGITRSYARIGLIRKSQFRVEFLAQVTMDVVWYATHALVFEILFGHAEDIAGWAVEDVRVFLGCLFVSDAWMMVWLGQGWHFGRELKDGKLDPFRVRPAPTIFLYFFQRFSLEGLFNMAIAFAYLLYAIGQSAPGFGLATPLWLAWALALMFWGRTVLNVLFTTLEFWILNSDLGHFAQESFHAAADRPLDIFGHRLRLFMLYVVPVGVLAYVPASMLLGRLTPLGSIGHTTWMALFGLAVFRLWNHGFTKYESAMS